MIHRIPIPNWRPARDNELISRHWRTRAKLKSQDKAIVAAYAMKCGIPKATDKRRVKLEITLTGRQQQADPYAYAKSCLDALAACGMLVDDTAEFVEWVPPRYTRCSIGPETVIVLEDLT